MVQKETMILGVCDVSKYLLEQVGIREYKKGNDVTIGYIKDTAKKELTEDRCMEMIINPEERINVQKKQELLTKLKLPQIIISKLEKEVLEQPMMNSIEKFKNNKYPIIIYAPGLSFLKKHFNETLSDIKNINNLSSLMDRNKQDNAINEIVEDINYLLELNPTSLIYLIGTYPIKEENYNQMAINRFFAKYNKLLRKKYSQSKNVFYIDPEILKLTGFKAKEESKIKVLK